MKQVAVLATVAALVAPAKGIARQMGSRVPSWWLGDALCVHSHEGSWRDPNPPYFGGMQMDYGFMRNYGSWALRRWGTADHWPVFVQLRVAYRGWRSQGWGAWPLSSHLCGLR